MEAKCTPSLGAQRVAGLVVSSDLDAGYIGHVLRHALKPDIRRVAWLDRLLRQLAMALFAVV